MLPYTPSKKNNMISWMSANCDGANYGQITVYKLPKEKMFYGPMQIESRIDQDTEISKQLSLWDQKGSKVIRGNLLVIPIHHTFLYVEPIYLQATSSKFPELKQVVVAYENRVVMDVDFESALRKVFSLDSGALQQLEKAGPAIPQVPQNASLKSLILDARKAFNQAQESQRRLDWNSYGKQIDQLGRILEQLERSK